ncbi:MAG: hypothetical protein VR65_04690 [Desulfobulbaceae bacterium BRH_c16a]|nr:MAG: hypothetical protein VR65_04105 [Desulfobulbaceae bacterium BRH_c16a]KJS02735.1 MAG: hypothetical protein VR65_04690 [Desulfobulbaceae bacterium BRH_c16a]
MVSNTVSKTFPGNSPDLAFRYQKSWRRQAAGHQTDTKCFTTIAGTGRVSGKRLVGLVSFSF